MRFPFDSAKRGCLMPFAFLCYNIGYVGLDKEGYDSLGELLKNANSEGIFIGVIPLDNFTEHTQTKFPLLTTRTFEDEKIYFPSIWYVAGNSNKKR